MFENPQVLVGLFVHTHSAYLIAQIHHPYRKKRGFVAQIKATWIVAGFVFSYTVSQTDNA